MTSQLAHGAEIGSGAGTSGTTEEEEEAKQAEPNQYEEKLKKNYEEFMAIVELESKKEIPMPPQKSAAGGALIKELF